MSSTNITVAQFKNLARMCQIRPPLAGRSQRRFEGFLKSLGLEVVRETGHCRWQYAGDGPKDSLIRLSDGVIVLSHGWPW